MILAELLIQTLWLQTGAGGDGGCPPRPRPPLCFSRAKAGSGPQAREKLRAGLRNVQHRNRLTSGGRGGRFKRYDMMMNRNRPIRGAYLIYMMTGDSTTEGRL